MSVPVAALLALPIWALAALAALAVGCLLSGLGWWRAQRSAASHAAACTSLRLDLARAEATHASLAQQQATRLADLTRHQQEREALLARRDAALEARFQDLASRVLEDRADALDSRSRARLDHLLSPLREQLRGFHDQVATLQREGTRERASLQGEVRALHAATRKVDAEAGRLASALKGDHQVQGSWGELLLEQVLEASGLRRGRDYSVQASLHAPGGQRKRPDVVVHLPEERDLVVDAKVSLGAWERAQACTDAAERDSLLARHAADLRAQVKRLAEQDYDRLPGLRSLDCVLLFVPVEAACSAALARDDRLVTDAWNHGVVLVTPGTLLLTLRIVQHLWRSADQDRNAREIAGRAGGIYDKLRGVLEDMERLGLQLQTAGRTFDSAMSRLATGKGNLVRQAEQLRELGAPVRRRIRRDSRVRAGEGSEALQVVAEPSGSQAS